MHRVVRLTVSLVAASAALISGWSASAQASNGKVSSSVTSHNGGGAYVSATWTWVSDDEYRLKDLYINDRCNAEKRDDGLSGFARIWIKRPEGNTITGEYPDLGGCRSAPVRYSTKGWEGATPIDAGAVQACVGKYDRKEISFTKVKCGPIYWRANHQR